MRDISQEKFSQPQKCSLAPFEHIANRTHYFSSVENWAYIVWLSLRGSLLVESVVNFRSTLTDVETSSSSSSLINLWYRSGVTTVSLTNQVYRIKLRLQSAMECVHVWEIQASFPPAFNLATRLRELSVLICSVLTKYRTRLNATHSLPWDLPIISFNNLFIVFEVVLLTIYYALLFLLENALYCHLWIVCQINYHKIKIKLI